MATLRPPAQGRTPWNTDHWAGGSSSGPGAATAAGLVGFSIGSETWGSIVCPSSFCGVSGLRPTFGRVSRYGAMALSYTMDKLGPMARSAEDCGTILEDDFAGQDGRDLTTSDDSRFRRGKLRGVKGLRLGVVRPDYRKDDKKHKAQPETETAFEGALGILTGLGAVLSDVTLPAIPMGEAAGTIISVEGFSGLRDDDPRQGASRQAGRRRAAGGPLGRACPSRRGLCPQPTYSHRRPIGPWRTSSPTMMPWSRRECCKSRRRCP